MPSTQTPPNIIVGIDPGYDRLGIAGISQEQKPSLLFADCITSDKKQTHYRRLQQIGEAVRETLHTWHPTAVAVEKLYFNKNVKTALLVAEARGVVLYEIARAGIMLYEYTPAEIKIAVTGHGTSDKEQVSFMVKKLIPVPPSIHFDDTFDAIALCLTQHAIHRT